MEKADPSSPAPSHSIPNNPSATTDDVLHSQLQQLIEHNASVPSVDAPSQMNSNAHSRLSSPTPQQQSVVMSIYDHDTPYAAAPPAPAYGGGYQQPGYQMEPSPYPQLPDTAAPMTPHNVYSSPATSPPTPLQGDGLTAMITRSGRTVNSRAQAGTPVLSGRVTKPSPKPRAGGAGAGAKKAKKKKVKAGSEESGVHLEAPLSVLVKDITNVQDTNIEEYVNRSPEVRQAEVRDSKEGKIKRPMNAFMLYRKAYQNRTKEWKKHDNHQVISQVCGISWAMEPQSLRDQYDGWAKIERNNHKLAFPDYKFAPAKAKNKIKLPTSKTPTNSDDSGSDLDSYDFYHQEETTRRNPYDPDAEYRPSGMRQPYPPQYPPRQSPMPHHSRLPYGQPHQSTFQYSNPGKPRPAEYGTGMSQNQYYQQTTEFTRPTYPNPYHHQMQPHYVPGQHHPAPIIENVFMNRTTSPAATSYHGGSPVDHYNDLMGSAYPPPPQPQHHHHHQVAMPHQRFQEHHPIDPSLTGGQQGPNQFDALGILNMDQNDGLSRYGLDQHSLGNAGRHQPFEQPFHHAAHDNADNTTWHDDSSIAGLTDGSKLNEEWERIASGGDLHFDNIDDILGTTDSPGGN